MDNLSQKFFRPPVNVCEVLGCSVNRTKLPHGRYAGLCGELHVAISSKESLDPCELEGEKILLSGLLDGFSELAEVLSRRKE